MQESIKQEKKEHRNLNKVQHSFSGVVIPLVFFVIPPGGLVIRMARLVLRSGIGIKYAIVAYNTGNHHNSLSRFYFNIF